MKRTALHHAAIIGRTDIGRYECIFRISFTSSLKSPFANTAQLLLNNQADPEALDVHGWNPRQMAELFSHREFQELMVRVTTVEKQAVYVDLPAAHWHRYLLNYS